MSPAPAPCPACGGARRLEAGLPRCPRGCAAGLRLPEAKGEWDSADGAGSRRRRPMYEDYDVRSVDDQDVASMFDDPEAEELDFG